MKLFIIHKNNAHPYDGITYYTQCKTKQAYTLKCAHQSPGTMCCQNCSYFILGPLASGMCVRSKGNGGREEQNQVQQTP